MSRYIDDRIFALECRYLQHGITPGTTLTRILETSISDDQTNPQANSPARPVLRWCLSFGGMGRPRHQQFIGDSIEDVVKSAENHFRLHIGEPTT